MTTNAKNKNHLPRFGVGPSYVITICALSIVGMVLHSLNILESGRLGNLLAKPLIIIAFCVIGTILITLGITLWILSIIYAKIGKSIYENRLVTTGIYAWVRNPIYSGAIFICTGAVMFCCNLWLLICPLIDYIFLTVLMICTEEKWLKKQYGQQYVNYCKKTNRCLPWFPKK